MGPARREADAWTGIAWCGSQERLARRSVTSHAGRKPEGPAAATALSGRHLHGPEDRTREGRTAYSIAPPGTSPAARALRNGWGQTFSTWPNSSSTGVARPKMDTATLRRERASSTSSTMPLKLANGPSETFTVSPTS